MTNTSLSQTVVPMTRIEQILSWLCFHTVNSRDKVYSNDEKDSFGWTVENSEIESTCSRCKLVHLKSAIPPVWYSSQVVR